MGGVGPDAILSGRDRPDKIAFLILGGFSAQTATDEMNRIFDFLSQNSGNKWHPDQISDAIYVYRYCILRNPHGIPKDGQEEGRK